MKLNACFFLFVAFLISFCAANAQQSNVVTVTTYKTVWPEGGKIAERDSLMNLWFENVAKKNGKIIHINYFVHYWGSDSRDYVIMAEYKSLSDMEKADSISTALWRLYMPDAKKRAEYNQKLGRYFDLMHSDEIYHTVPKFTK